AQRPGRDDDVAHKPPDPAPRVTGPGIGEAADHADRAPGREEHPSHPTARVETGPRTERARDVGNVHRLLRILRAPDGAHARAEAAALGARDASSDVAHALRAPLDDAAHAGVAGSAHGIRGEKAH